MWSAKSAPTVAAPPESGVAGFVFRDANGNGTFDVGEAAVAGAAVRLYSTGPLALLDTKTDDEGIFRFDEIEYITPGETTVRLRITPLIEGPDADTFPETSGLSQEYTVGLGTTTSLAAKVYTQCASLDECPNIEPPDLTPILTAAGGEDFPPPTTTFIDTEEIPGRTLLRFATSTANVGGLLHIVALDTHPVADGEAQPVQQFVYGDDHVYIHDAGEFIYHEVRQRFHVNDYVNFELLSEDQSVVLAENAKISFCLTDVQQYEVHDIADGDVFLELPPSDCGLAEQGINSGWADYYGPRLFDQWIDVTDLPAGKYWIRITVDPKQQYIETDTENNAVLFPIDYTPPTP